MREELWIFGYGSLVWRPAFPFAERRGAWIDGFARRFWQGSTDHRGVPGAPGRVVTLEPEPNARCFGVAYRIADEDSPRVLEGLDHRERGGYERRRLPLFFTDGAVAHGLVYVATPDNPNYLGPAPLEAIAAQVARARVRAARTPSTCCGWPARCASSRPRTTTCSRSSACCALPRRRRRTPRSSPRRAARAARAWPRRAASSG